MADGALDGLVIADFSRVLAGPLATQLLGDLGAEVIKIESPAGDDTRRWRPPEHGGVSTYYLGVNRNKKSVVFDLHSARDRQLARELAARADVVVENFRPGTLQRFGLDYASVSAMNPRSVYASISGYGEGAGARLPGYDLTVQAASGLMSLTGPPDGEAFRTGVSVFDVTTGLHATIGILAALRHRDRTGAGQHVRVNLLGTALAVMSNHALAAVVGDAPSRMGNAHPSLFPYEPFRAADGEIVVVAANDKQFGALARVLEHPEWAEDDRFSSPRARNIHRDILRPLLTRALGSRRVQEWFELLTAAGIPCAPINSIEAGIAFAEQLGLEPVVELDAHGAAVPGIRNPIGMTATPPRYDLPPPVLDEHGEHVRDWLLQAGSASP